MLVPTDESGPHSPGKQPCFHLASRGLASHKLKAKGQEVEVEVEGKEEAAQLRTPQENNLQLVENLPLIRSSPQMECILHLMRNLWYERSITHTRNPEMNSRPQWMRDPPAATTTITMAAQLKAPKATQIPTRTMIMALMPTLNSLQGSHPVGQHPSLCCQ